MNIHRNVILHAYRCLKLINRPSHNAGFTDFLLSCALVSFLCVTDDKIYEVYEIY